VVFLINGIPVLVIECKNASKDEAIALGVDQIRRYHRETPELFVYRSSSSPPPTPSAFPTG
jgi:type I restriction enzyme R subunit